jgi:glycosyltransferase involved in cell wall biosynthesis
MRILYVLAGLGPPPKDPRLDKMFYVSDPVCGDILFPTWYREPGQIRIALTNESYPEHTVGNFTYHFYLAGKYPVGHPIQKLAIFCFYLRQGLKLIRKQKYDCIVTYGWTLTGVAAWILRRLSGAKLIVEIGITPHHYNQFGRYGATSVTFGMKAAKFVSDMLVNVIAGSADRLQLRYPTQLERYPKLHGKPVSIIHGFIAVSNVPCTAVNEDYLLLVGAPWYLKGVDLLVQAFHRIKTEFPGLRLKALGHYTDAEELEKLVAGEPRIELMKARKNHEVLALTANASIFVLASRTEAGGRVLIEAMGAGKPIVVSSADGNPYYVRDGVNGLVFESGNADDLAEKLRILLRSPELRRKLGDKGYELAHSIYNEASFGREFGRMVELTVRGSAASTAAGQDRSSAEVGAL